MKNKQAFALSASLFTVGMAIGHIVTNSYDYWISAQDLQKAEQDNDSAHILAEVSCSVLGQNEGVLRTSIVPYGSNDVGADQLFQIAVEKVQTSRYGFGGINVRCEVVKENIFAQDLSLVASNFFKDKRVVQEIDLSSAKIISQKQLEDMLAEKHSPPAFKLPELGFVSN